MTPCQVTQCLEKLSYIEDRHMSLISEPLGHREDFEQALRAARYLLRMVCDLCKFPLELIDHVLVLRDELKQTTSMLESAMASREIEAMSAAVNIVVSMESVIVPPNSSGEVCPVCQDEFDMDRIVKVGRCSHKFHECCLFEWLQFNTSCPVCRAVMQL